ncbi:hypothetical protein CRENBAI_013353 [Crenichthys baileyi]|uniref:Uncharacterized protein n=1 Tax=Crenichthys baileyi TaxID=28760 RepID=A0AAV9R1L6_9TELE
MRRPAAPSSARLSTEEEGGFPARGLAPDQPSPLLPTPNPVPGPVLEGSEDELPPSLFPKIPSHPFRRSSWRTCLHFLFLSLRDARTHPLCLLCLSSSAADLHTLAKGPSSLHTATLSYTVGSPSPAAGRQIFGSYVTGLLSSYVAGLLIAGPAPTSPAC